jgi:hypothetical protein
MGQAIVDPPDPRENSKPAPTNSADDLLSQLAGNEIDRLLAESEGQTPATPAAATLSPAAPPPSTESVGFDSAQSAAEIDALLSAAEQPAAQPQTQKPPAAVSPADVLNEIVKKDAASATVAPTAAKVDSSPLLMLNVPPPLPLILKPLEWINAPLDAFPDRVREAIGKIAILTMMNAVAVLTYVLIFRRHH